MARVVVPSGFVVGCCTAADLQAAGVDNASLSVSRLVALAPANGVVDEV